MTEEQHQSSSSLDSSGAFDAGAAQDFAGEAREHVVVPGDTLAGLCLKYAVSARALRTLNKLDGDNAQRSGVVAAAAARGDAAALEDCVARLEARDWDFGACVAAHEAENDPFSPAFRPRRAAAAAAARAAGRRAFELFAPNELLPDSPLGETQPLP
ncbi:hypothetical protein JL720_1301 [Aureococcus anophagefferens]|nr:hypothetical protein JL720_1301 [Aureococcus anophagefferens]